MPNFQVKTKQELHEELYPTYDTTPRPGDKVPVASEDGLRELGATEFYPRSWQYRSVKHTLDDLQRPGYFSGENRTRLRTGDEIHYTMEGGKKLPSEWVRGICVVEENPNTREKPLILAGYCTYEQPTSWCGKTKGKE